MAEKNKILEIVTGSHLYGTATETSDKDYVGVFLPDIPYILGFKRVEEVDFSIKDKDVNGKNTERALDRKFYEFRKFIALAKDNNPNVLETLFVNEENIVFINDVGRELLSMRHSFLHKGLKQRFVGYAIAQRHKMVIKKDNYFDLLNSLSYLRMFHFGKTLLEIMFKENTPYFIKRQNDVNGNISFIQIGDLNFNPSIIVKNATTKIQERIDKVGNREELLTKYGYDVKYSMNLIRLMLSGIELLKTGDLIFPLKDWGVLRDIRNGKWEMMKVLDYSYELEKEIEDITENSVIPNKPNEDLIESFTIRILHKMIANQNHGFFKKFITSIFRL